MPGEGPRVQGIGGTSDYLQPGWTWCCFHTSRPPAWLLCSASWGAATSQSSSSYSGRLLGAPATSTPVDGGAHSLRAQHTGCSVGIRAHRAMAQHLSSQDGGGPSKGGASLALTFSWWRRLELGQPERGGRGWGSNSSVKGSVTFCPLCPVAVTVATGV